MNNADTTSTPTLNVAAWERRSVANGPGTRFVLWVQGCPFRCPGCFNQDFLPNVEANRMTVAEVVDLILGTSGIDGVTFSGGEPFAQAGLLAMVAENVKAAGLTVISYSGYRLEELQRLRNPGVAHLLGLLDILIDGRYEEEKNSSLPNRGSDNQKVHILTDTYRHLADEIDKANRNVEFIVGLRQHVATGVFDSQFLTRLEEVMQEATFTPSDLPPFE